MPGSTDFSLCIVENSEVELCTPDVKSANQVSLFMTRKSYSSNEVNLCNISNLPHPHTIQQNREVKEKMRGKFQKFSLAVGLALLSLPMFAKMPPGDLTSQVRHELIMLPYYSVFDDLEFKVDGNTVTLYGDVTRPVLKSDAQNVVKRIPGVASVVNNIKVLPLSPFDNRIRAAEYRSIYGFSSMYRYAMGTNPSIRIIVENGHVTLKGYVDNLADRNIATIRANSVPGVFSVSNELKIPEKG